MACSEAFDRWSGLLLSIPINSIACGIPKICLHKPQTECSDLCLKIIPCLQTSRCICVSTAAVVGQNSQNLPQMKQRAQLFLKRTPYSLLIYSLCLPCRDLSHDWIFQRTCLSYPSPPLQKLDRMLHFTDLFLMQSITTEISTGMLSKMYFILISSSENLHFSVQS